MIQNELQLSVTSRIQYYVTVLPLPKSTCSVLAFSCLNRSIFVTNSAKVGLSADFSSQHVMIKVYLMNENNMWSLHYHFSYLVGYLHNSQFSNGCRPCIKHIQLRHVAIAMAILQVIIRVNILSLNNIACIAMWFLVAMLLICNCGILFLLRSPVVPCNYLLRYVCI